MHPFHIYFILVLKIIIKLYLSHKIMCVKNKIKPILFIDSVCRFSFGIALIKSNPLVHLNTKINDTLNCKKNDYFLF